MQRSQNACDSQHAAVGRQCAPLPPTLGLDCICCTNRGERTYLMLLAGATMRFNIMRCNKLVFHVLCALLVLGISKVQP